MTFKRAEDFSGYRLANVSVIAAACLFVLLATYRIHLPGLYYDEVIFVNAAQGGPGNNFVYRLGSVPLFVMPYMGALKAWLYAPIFHVCGVSVLTIRLPAVLLAGVTLLIFYHAMRGTLGPLWASAVVWIMAIDPLNLFTSRLDWGPTVLMHLFQAAIIALWFSYRQKPKLWKPIVIVICFGLGCFDKFNFVWFALAFSIGTFVCYRDSVKDVWASLPRLVPWIVAILGAIALGIMLYLVRHLLYSTGISSVKVTLTLLIGTMSGATVAEFVFQSHAGIISFTPVLLIVIEGLLALTCLALPLSNAQARENRKNGFFFLIIGFLIFAQIVITPHAGGPHHYAMIFPWPLLAFAFLAKSLYAQIAKNNLRLLAALLLACVAICLFWVNAHNTTVFFTHFRTNQHYNPRWSPAIYSLSEYINKHGYEARRIMSLDWGLDNQLRALAPKKLQQRMRDYWPDLRELDEKTMAEQRARVDGVFPEGKSFALTFAESKETFPETRRNFLAAVAFYPQFKSRLMKEFWFGGEKIYELYEVVREPATQPAASEGTRDSPCKRIGARATIVRRNNETRLTAPPVPNQRER
jgi:Dolichyl-phosphate-mannose-protein mannosyltransferase